MTMSIGDQVEGLRIGAQEIGDRLCALAVPAERGVLWPGAVMDAQGRVCMVDDVGPAFMDGVPGIIFFLAYLGRLSGDERYTTTARSGMAAIRQTLPAAAAHADRIGAFRGAAGALYLFTHLAILWQDDALMEEAEALAAGINTALRRDRHFGVVDGAAGAIGALLSLHAWRPSRQLLRTARLCGDHLLQHAQAGEHGIFWPSPHGEPARPLGFAFGNSGIAWALLRLAEITGHDAYREGALEALAGERRDRPRHRLSVAEASHLLRRKEAPPPPSAATSWCFGSAGMGMGRLATLNYLVDDATCREIYAAMDKTEQEGFGYDHTLCHGDLGNAELFLQSAQLLEHAAWQEKWSRVSQRILDSLAAHGPRCGLPDGVESPGLMLGLAGIGYGLLRLAQPSLAPSVLLLEAPSPRLAHGGDQWPISSVRGHAR